MEGKESCLLTRGFHGQNLYGDELTSKVKPYKLDLVRLLLKHINGLTHIIIGSSNGIIEKSYTEYMISRFEAIPF